MHSIYPIIRGYAPYRDIHSRCGISRPYRRCSDHLKSGDLGVGSSGWSRHFEVVFGFGTQNHTLSAHDLTSSFRNVPIRTCNSSMSTSRPVTVLRPPGRDPSRPGSRLGGMWLYLVLTSDPGLALRRWISEFQVVRYRVQVVDSMWSVLTSLGHFGSELSRMTTFRPLLDTMREGSLWSPY